MAEYNFRAIEKKWQKYWEDNQSFLANVDKSKPKYYSLDMFPYPSGAGLHVGHPLGYIASDIVSRYKRIKGFNVLHPMGFDAFGLPAEQYAIQTGQHPAATTEENIKRYKEQLRNIGFSFDWSKELRTSNPDYHKWTQWIFMQLFNSWYNKDSNKAEPISTLIEKFESNGYNGINAACDEYVTEFSADEWKDMSEKEKSDILLQYRLAFLADTTVNWCPALGTVLANEEVKDGLSERGGYPVIRKTMKQWSLRITAYAERLLEGLESIDWPEPVKEMQRNWIGKSIGAELEFRIDGHDDLNIKVFTTRVDTIFGVTYLALAPEHELIEKITNREREKAVKDYVAVAKNRSERDRMSDVKTITGEFTGAYAIHPFTGKQIPIWTADYVLAGYGTGAVMAVPAGDTRDYDFARHFGLPMVITQEGTNLEEGANPSKVGKVINSDFLNGLEVADAQKLAIEKLEEMSIGKGKVNFRMRDAIFSRQRYWGEPFPVYFKDEIPYLLEESELPLRLPEVDKYLPTEEGDPPLGRADKWTTKEGYPLEKSTMPGWAGSSWYFFRYMDPSNEGDIFSKEIQHYWENVDLYIGGSEHATGHLLYARFWTKFLKDLGFASVEEPFKKLINQGMIQGRSNFVYRVNSSNKYVSHNLRKEYDTTRLHVDVNIVHNDILDLEAFRNWRPDFSDAEFILEDGKYICGSEVEKMSKSKFNVVNPDDIIERFGADTLRLYEMFLGPLEQFKPWNTNGIDGVYKFLKKLWKLFHDSAGNFNLSDEKPNKQELKVIHATIKKVEEDIERFSFNTSVSTFMICVNELTALKCNKREILEKLILIVSPYAPHIAEELWALCGHQTSVAEAQYPAYNEEYLKEDAFEYPVSINGKMRVKLSFAVDTPKKEIEEVVLENEIVKKWIEGKAVKKLIIVPKKIINVVI
ncbi:leucine--tRNA ligase [Xanthovirga aplysinae]|uniref:leucine--tRNA ligase n=1 Tax=Xanthovirga aplysinae TaxID=2529853 RepID=UPI0012BCEEB5|nr:leucine--tRNA ligase [Xanthovirga aplysinae]MTI30550.1 leucine--tRNA ligase [Xanthovirga aplysinae]